MQNVFLNLFSELIITSTFLCCSCSREETHYTHRRMSQCLHLCSHCSKECFWHFLYINPLFGWDHFVFWDLSTRCFPLQYLHKCLSQMLQCKDGSGISHRMRWHRATSWKLHSLSMLVDRHFHHYQRWISGRKNIYTGVFCMFY